MFVSEEKEDASCWQILYLHHLPAGANWVTLTSQTLTPCLSQTLLLTSHRSALDGLPQLQLKSSRENGIFSISICLFQPTPLISFTDITLWEFYRHDAFQHDLFISQVLLSYHGD